MARPFVGRTRELSEIEGGLDEASSGRGSLFLVSGEPGIGKTRLADEVAEAAARRGLRVAWGRCWQGDGSPPYWLWTQVLRAFGAELPGAGAVSDGAQARFAMFQDVFGILERACRAQASLVVVDDLHAADHSSLVLLGMLVSELRALRLVIVATCRDRDASISAEREPLVASITRDATYVPMRRFLAREVVALAEHMGLALSAERAAAVQRVTEGHPLFVDQVLRVLVARGDDAGEVPIPPGVREAIRARLRMLDGETRAALEIAAVFGQEIAVPLIAAVAGPDAARRLPTSIAAAVAAGVLIEHGEGRLSFAHVLLRDELYGALDPDRRIAIHAAAVMAAELPPDVVAHHALEARTVIGAERAAAAVLRAAQRSLDLLAFEDAAALLDRALHVLEPALPAATVVDLLLTRGLAFIRAGATERGQHACERAAELARTCGDAIRLARVALTYGAEFVPAQVNGRLIALLEESLVALPSDQGALRARVLARLAAALQPAVDPGVPIRMAQEAIAAARPLDDATRRATFYAAASALADWGDPTERIGVNVETARLAAGAGDNVQALRSHARLVFDYMEVGDPESADVHLGIHESLAEGFREPRYRWHGSLMRAMRALFAGRFDEVDRLQAEAEQRLAPADDPVFRAAVTWQRCQRLIDEGNLDDLLAFDARVRAVLSPHPLGRLLLAIHDGKLHARRGDRDQAAAALASLGGIRPPSAGPLIAGMLAETYACAGTPAQVDDVYGILLPFADRFLNLGFSGMTVEAPISRLLGVLASAAGRTGEAVAHFDHAIARLERLDAPRWLERTRRERDVAERGRGATVRVPPPVAPSNRGFELRLEGEYFVVEYGAKVMRLKDSRGLRMLAHLVEHAGREHHVLALAGAFDDVAGDSGEVLDREAGAQYRERVEDLREELREAESFGDSARAERARAELDAIAAELARGFGLGGRARKAGSDAERARVNVQRHLRKAIRKIGEGDPDLEKYLDYAVTTGAYCSYATK